MSINRCDSESLEVDVFELITVPTDALIGTATNVAEITALRCVGELALGCVAQPGSAAGGSFSVIFGEGIYLADTLSDGSILVKDPSDPDEAASKDWLWRRMTVLPFNTTSVIEHELIGKNDWGNAFVDIRVKRKMRKEESLVYAVTTLFDQTSPPHIVVSGGINITQVFPYLIGNLRVIAALP